MDCGQSTLFCRLDFRLVSLCFFFYLCFHGFLWPNCIYWIVILDLISLFQHFLVLIFVSLLTCSALLFSVFINLSCVHHYSISFTALSLIRLQQMILLFFIKQFQYCHDMNVIKIKTQTVAFTHTWNISLFFSQENLKHYLSQCVKNTLLRVSPMPFWVQTCMPSPGEKMEQV